MSVKPSSQKPGDEGDAVTEPQLRGAWEREAFRWDRLPPFPSSGKGPHRGGRGTWNEVLREARGAPSPFGYQATTAVMVSREDSNYPHFTDRKVEAGGEDLLQATQLGCGRGVLCHACSHPALPPRRVPLCQSEPQPAPQEPGEAGHRPSSREGKAGKVPQHMQGGGGRR